MIEYKFLKLESMLGSYQGHDDFLFGFYLEMSATNGTNIVKTKRYLEFDLSEENVYIPFNSYTKEMILSKVEELIVKHKVKEYLQNQLSVLENQLRVQSVEIEL